MFCFNQIHPDWLPVFENLKDDFKDVQEILEKDNRVRIVPDKEDIFNVFKTGPKEIKVLILGQDPYPSILDTGEPVACGYSFAVRKDVKIPGSLQNIFKEIKNEYPSEFKTPSHGSLEKWTQQGVFLLNTSLTCRQGVPGSHGKIWMFLVIEVIKTIIKNNSSCIYVLWGKEAQTIKSYIGNKGIILESAHPSGLSAYGRNGRQGFFGNGHFKKINELLTDQGKNIIDWNT